MRGRASYGEFRTGVHSTCSPPLASGHIGSYATATQAEVFERAELHADWAEARPRPGDSALVGDLVRTRAQRGADALYAIFMRAASGSADGRSPEPVVNIVVDQQTFEEELRRAAGEDVVVDPNESLGGRRCHGTDGTPLRPAEVLAAAVVGHVRRVVVDGRGTVIDLGTMRRLFTGSARGGPTEPGNSDAYCGFHNRIEERGYRPERGPDGRWVIHRPGQGGPLTPPV